MSALESIIEWAESDLPEWQSDAVRRLLLQEILTDKERDDLLLMLKSSSGLLPEEAVLPEPQPIRKGEISGAPRVKANIILKSVKNLRNVNRIPDDSEIPFGHHGVTVIYGENGSGKSGYARVLKRACRARDREERILPNVFGPNPGSPASATFKLSLDGRTDREIQWTDGGVPYDALTNVTLFDSKCARIIVDERNEISYLPYGSHVFEGLAGVLNWMKQQLTTEKPRPECPQWPEVKPSTSSWKFLNGITHATKQKDVEEAIAWTTDDDNRLKKVSKQLAEIEADNPSKQAAGLRSLKRRVENLRDYINKRKVVLSNESLEDIKGCTESFTQTNKALELLAKEALVNEPLKGAGGDAWQILYSTARDYSLKDAYPDRKFPSVDAGSRCVFCMQELQEEAKERLLRFRDFMEQETKEKRDRIKSTLDDKVKSINNLMREDIGQHQDTITEINQRNPDIAESAKSYLSSLEERFIFFGKLIGGKTPGEPPPMPTDPVSNLEQIISTLEDEAKKLEEWDPEKTEKLMSEKLELMSRECLATHRSEVTAYLADLKTCQKYEHALDLTDTSAITRKGKSILSETITPEFREAILSELDVLGAGHIPLGLRPTGSKGETLFQLELNGAVMDGKVRLSEVLSEGEQQVVALAGFLAETSLGDHTCPVILDDPVCSLDHRYRARIAQRVVQESKRRQVIIFTHDIAFLLEMQENAGQIIGTHFTPQTVTPHNQNAGIPNKGLPWHVMPVKTRLGHLRESLSKVKHLYNENRQQYNKEVAYLYALLRETWEAAVEEVLLYKTIVRHGKVVQTLRLKRVGVTTEQYTIIHNNMTKCSEWMVGHDRSKSLDVNRPEPSEILRDIEVLFTFVRECKTKADQLEKERDNALNPESSEVG